MAWIPKNHLVSVDMSEQDVPQLMSCCKPLAKLGVVSMDDDPVSVFFSSGFPAETVQRLFFIFDIWQTLHDAPHIDDRRDAPKVSPYLPC